MDSQLDARLQAIEAKLEENTKILSKINRAQKIALYTRYAYWGLLIALAVASVSFIKPYVSQLTAAYGIADIQTGLDSSRGILEQLKQFQSQNQ